MLFKREIFYYQEINPAIILWKESTIGKETQSVTTLDLRVCEGERERERERQRERERRESRREPTTTATHLTTSIG